MLRHLGIRWKVLAVLALPVLVLAVGSGAFTAAALEQVSTERTTGMVSGAGGALVRLEAALQAERLASVSASWGTGWAQVDLAAARGATDAALTAVDAALPVTGDGSRSAAVSAALATAGRVRAALASARARVEAAGVLPGPDAAAVTADYSALVQPLVELPATVARSTQDRAEAGRLDASTATAQALEALSRGQLAGLRMIHAGRVGAAQQQELAVSAAAFDDAVARLRGLATASEQAVLAAAVPVPADRSGPQALADSLRAAAGGAAVTLPATRWRQAGDRQAQQLRSLAQLVAQDAAAGSAQAVDSARQRLALTLAAAVLLVGVSVLFALMVSRRITAPLRSLTGFATGLAENLPDLVERIQAGDAVVAAAEPVDAGHDEVGRLAAAFAEVNATTLRVAREQAVLRAAVAETFVTIARRNQVLLSRQLAFIDQLERTEEDPDALENLFRLDHLATRMRRNAESLLVLAGIDSGRRLRAPMPLSDVVRTAVSEIEHYDRVRTRVGVDPPVVSHLALTLAHLVAELVENAAAFSDPGTPVQVTSAATQTPTGPGVRLSISDEGLGMRLEDLVAANARLAGPSIGEVMGSQRLGLFVVGRLAARLDARVWLEPGPQCGSVAVVELSPALFTPDSLAGPAADGRLPAGGTELGGAGRAGPNVPRDIVPGGRASRPGPAAPPPPPGVLDAAPDRVLDLGRVDTIAWLEQLAAQGPVPETWPEEGLSAPESSPSQQPAAELDVPEWLSPASAPPEPVVAEPVVAEPVVAEPVVAEPVVAEPVVAEPVAAEPVAAEPVGAGPGLPAPRALPRRQPAATAPAADAPPAPLQKATEPRPEPPRPWAGIRSAPAASALPPAAAPAAPPAPYRAPTATGSGAGAAHGGTSTRDVLPQHHGRLGFRLGRRHRQPVADPVQNLPAGPPARDSRSAAEPSGAAAGGGWAPRPRPGVAGGAGGGAASAGSGTPAATARGLQPAPPRVSAAGSEEERLRHALTSEALSELSMLSSYRPAAEAPSAPTALVHRTPAATPAARAPEPILPVAETPPLQGESAADTARPLDPAAVRATLSGFSAGVRRARTDQVTAGGDTIDEWRTSP